MIGDMVFPRDNRQFIDNNDLLTINNEIGILFLFFFLFGISDIY